MCLWGRCGDGGGRRGVCAAVVTFVGGVGSQAGGGDVSLLPRDHAERRACMRGPREAQDGGEATGRRASAGTGAAEATADGRAPGEGAGSSPAGRTGGQFSTLPLQMCKRGPRESWGRRGARRRCGDPTSPPPADLHPVRKPETSGIETHGGVAGRGMDGQTDKRALA